METPDPSGVPKDPSVHPHRHHPGVHRGLRDEFVEGINEKFTKSPPRHQGAAHKLRVIGHQGVRNDQVGPILHLDPVRELIIVGVAIVREATVLNEKLPGNGRRCVAAVPSFGGTSDQPMDRVKRPSDLVSLCGLVEKVVLNPAPAVAHDVPIAVGDRLSSSGIPFQCQSRGEDRERESPVPEEPADPPEPDAAPVFEHAFSREVPVPPRNPRLRDLGEGGVGATIPVLERVLRTFFVIQHEVDSQSLAPRPTDIRRVVCVAHEVALALHLSPGSRCGQMSSQIPLKSSYSFNCSGV